MTRACDWGKLGRVVSKHNQSTAEADTTDLGKRYKITGPPRGHDEQQALDDLLRIRASTDGASTRLEGLQAMRAQAKRLHDEAKASRTSGPRNFEGGIEGGAAYSDLACIQYWDELGKHTVRGPSRTGRRRAEADLAKLRAASQGHDTWVQQVRSLQETAERLHEQAQRENRVAFGAEQYELQRMAHKTDDSDSENEGGPSDGYEYPYADIL